MKDVTHAGVVCLIAIPSDSDITIYILNAERNDELSNCMFLIGQIVIIDFVVFCWCKMVGLSLYGHHVKVI
jgi:hypothetical protein